MITGAQRAGFDFEPAKGTLRHVPQSIKCPTNKSKMEFIPITEKESSIFYALYVNHIVE